MEAGDLVATKYNSPYVLVEKRTDCEFWRIFYLNRQVYRTLSSSMIESDIKLMNDGTQNVTRDR